MSSPKDYLITDVTPGGVEALVSLRDNLQLVSQSVATTLLPSIWDAVAIAIDEAVVKEVSIKLGGTHTQTHTHNNMQHTHSCTRAQVPPTSLQLVLVSHLFIYIYIVFRFRYSYGFMFVYIYIYTTTTQCKLQSAHAVYAPVFL